jgi:hypothetical protein
MKPVTRKRSRLVAILLFPLVAVAFLGGFALTVLGERKQHRTKPKMKPPVRESGGFVTLEIIEKQEELQVQ